MMKQIWNLGAMALVAATIVVGCSDSIVDSASTDAVATYDAYDATVLNETIMATYGEVPSTNEELMDSTRVDTTFCSGDSLRGDDHGGRGPGGRGPGGRGGHGGERGHGHDGGIGNIAPLGIRNYRAAASQLGLTAQQDSLFRQYLADLRSCAGDAAAAYRTAREAAFAPYKTNIDSIRAAVKAGTMTRDEAKVQLDSIRAQFEAVIAPLNEQLRAAVAACRSSFESSVESMLTEAQLQLWLTLK
jgi:hypothetical protein